MHCRVIEQEKNAPVQKPEIKIHSNFDITDPHNPLIFSTVYRRYVIPVLRTKYVIWKQRITHIQQSASKTGRNKTKPK